MRWPNRPHSVDQEKEGGARDDQELVQPSGDPMASGRKKIHAIVNATRGASLGAEANRRTTWPGSWAAHKMQQCA